MTDIYDRAQQLEQRLREEALACQMEAARQRGASLSHCYDCGDPIPEERRQAAPGCTRCTLCQSTVEKPRR